MARSSSRFQPERRIPTDPLNCAVCGGKEAFLSLRAKGLAEGDSEFRVLRCPDCGYGWTDPTLPDTEIGRWYPAAYYGRENVRFNAFFEMLVRLFRRRRAEEIVRRVPPSPVLDVGCGRGLILGQLKAMGYETHGVEVSEDAAWHARHKMGAEMHVGNFLTADLKPEHFGAIIFWHSLEHFRKPIHALLHARTLLRKGGLLVVAVPNSDSFQARAFRADWFHLDIPRHYAHFGLRSLEAVLLRAGFRVTSVSHFSLEQNPYGWLQSFYNAMELEFNFLYSFLKNRTARMVPLRKHPWQAAFILLTLPVLLPLSLALTVLETVLRRGGSVEIYAFKE